MSPEITYNCVFDVTQSQCILVVKWPRNAVAKHWVILRVYHNSDTWELNVVDTGTNLFTNRTVDSILPPILALRNLAEILSWEKWAEYKNNYNRLEFTLKNDWQGITLLVGKGQWIPFEKEPTNLEVALIEALKRI